MRALLVLAATACCGLLTVPAGAEPHSFYTSIAARACASTHPKRNAREHEIVTERCRTPFGLTIVATYTGTSMQLAFLRPGETREPQLGGSYGHGDMVEWRGQREGRRFVPASAIVRLLFSTGAATRRSVLAVLRIEKDRVCPVAFVDGGAPDANTLARTAADDAVASCAAGDAKILGPATEWAREARDRSRR